jgi:hypothetical protein
MRRVGHGETYKVDGPAILADVGAVPTIETFGFMFPGLTDNPDHRLPESAETVANLKALGATVVDSTDTVPVPGGGEGDSAIPAAYTYFGQFIDHDITFDTGSAGIDVLASPALQPRPNLDGLTNSRTVHLDLDCVYASGAPRNGDLMELGTVTAVGARPPGKGDLNDLPRESRSADPAQDRAARIGDPRNDENLIVSQLHLAFLKAHNALVSQGRNFDQARTALRQRFQLMVLGDFLPRICDPAVVQDVVQNGSGWDLGITGALFMPVEFSAAAYRFGHSMIRTQYDYNLNFSPTDLSLLFTFTALSGQLGPGAGLDSLPENWIIQWERFIALQGSTPQMARKINTQLSNFTFRLQDTFGNIEGSGSPDANVQQIAPLLATRNLLRGYLLRLPTGQAVARELGLNPLSGQVLLDALPNDAMRGAAAPFAERTPLWFYVLAEAGDPAGPDGRHLGAVGSRIVANAFRRFIEQSQDSVLSGPVPPDIQSFTLADLIELAGPA